MDRPQCQGLRQTGPQYARLQVWLGVASCLSAGSRGNPPVQASRSCLLTRLVCASRSSSRLFEAEQAGSSPGCTKAASVVYLGSSLQVSAGAMGHCTQTYIDQRLAKGVQEAPVPAQLQWAVSQCSNSLTITLLLLGANITAKLQLLLIDTEQIPAVSCAALESNLQASRDYLASQDLHMLANAQAGTVG